MRELHIAKNIEHASGDFGRASERASAKLCLSGTVCPKQKQPGCKKVLGQLKATLYVHKLVISDQTLMSCKVNKIHLLKWYDSFSNYDWLCHSVTVKIMVQTRWPSD